MRLPFLKKASSAEPLILAMTGVRLGDAVLFSGRSPAHLLPLAARTGLSGRCLVVGPGDATGPLEASAARQGVLVDTAATAPHDQSFDLAVIEAVGDWAAAASAARPALRPGGRVIVVAGEPRAGLLARFSPRQAPVRPDAIVAALTRERWTRARAIGERDGLLFVEAFA